MRVKFLKDHNRHRKGEVADVLLEAGNYYVRCNVAVQADAQPEAEKIITEQKKAAPKKAAKKK
jgi:hypothetical protein